MIPRTSLVDVRSTFSGRLGCWLLFEISIRKSSPWSRRLLLQFTYVFPGFISCCITILHIQHHPILFQLNFLMWAIDQTQWCLPTSVTESTGSTWVNHHLASIHHVCEYNRNAKLWPAMFAHRIIYIYINLWKKHGHDGKFEHCVCAHHHEDWGARLILWETIWNSRLFPWPNSIINAGGRGVTENSRLQWRA